MTVTIPYYFLELLFLFFCLFFLLLFSTIFSCFNCKIFRLFKKSSTDKLRWGWLSARIKSVVISGEGRQTTDNQETQRSRGREREREKRERERETRHSKSNAATEDSNPFLADNLPHTSKKGTIATPAQARHTSYLSSTWRC